MGNEETREPGGLRGAVREANGRGRNRRSHMPSPPLAAAPARQDSVPEWSETLRRDAFFDPRVRRVAVLRHPVERIISSWRAFCTSAAPDSPKAKKTMTLAEYARGPLRKEMLLPCDAARRQVNQHFRAQRCFCGFDEVPDLLARTKLLLLGSGPQQNLAAIRAVLPEPELWTNSSTSAGWLRSNLGPHRNLTAEQYLTPR